MYGYFEPQHEKINFSGEIDMKAVQLVDSSRAHVIDNSIRTSLRALIGGDDAGASIIDSDGKYLDRVLDFPMDICDFVELEQMTRKLGVTEQFREVIDDFKVPEKETPAGFRIEYVYEGGGVVRVDLVRDISYDRNGEKRPTKQLFSVDSANPYEIAPMKNLIANLTCNPGIVYDLFINNPEANVGGKFKTRDEVFKEIGSILGPGVDMSVELNNPFDEDWNRILDEAEKFRQMLSKHRIVIKVPHTGPVNAQNVNQLLEGDKLFAKRYNDGATADFYRGHELALFLKEHGFRINFTLMFEPHQGRMALQAKPYIINTFIRHRKHQSDTMKDSLLKFKETGKEEHLQDIRALMLQKDYLGAEEKDLDLCEVRKMAEHILAYRHIDDPEGSDGLDASRHFLRLLRNSNLPDTRLILCSMEGEENYPDIDKMLSEEEFADMQDRVIITAEPQYLAKFTSCNQVISYQRRFMNAAQGEN